jgi:hypothetical protein
MSREIAQQIDQAVRRRESRIPTRFKSYSTYLQAVEGGLLTQEPAPLETPPSMAELRRQIDAMVDEAMPPWAPRLEGPTAWSLIVMARSDGEYEHDDLDD